MQQDNIQNHNKQNEKHAAAS